MAAAHIFHKLVISAHLFLKMTSWGYCVLAYNCSGEPSVRRDISGTFRIDSVVIRVWSCCSQFGGGCPERGFLKKISHGCSWELDSLLSTLWICFWGSGSLSSFLQVMLNLLLESGKDDVPTGVETDGQTPGIASCGLQSDVSEVVYSRSRSWELRVQSFDDGKIHVQMRNLPVLFLIGSRFHLIFAF